MDYGFDVLNRLETVTDETGTTSYGYDAVGNRASMSYPNGTVTEYQYDGRHRLTQLTHRRLGAVLLGLSYLLNPDGTRAAIIEDTDGVITRSTEYAYDAVKRLTSETVRDGIGATQRQTGWIFDRVGNRLEQTVTDNTAVVGASLLAITNYQYDQNDRLSTETTDTSIDGVASGSDTTSYTYDAKGNTLTKVTGGQTLAQYQWDSAGRLRQAITPDPENPGSDTTTRYTYLADGIRRSQTERFGEAGAETTRYLIDPVQAFAQVLEERVTAAGASGAGELIAAYTYGDDLISLRRPTDGQGGLGSAETRWYHVDGLGSTRLLSDASGSVTDRYAYTAYGEMDQAASQVASENSYLYTGEQFDAGLGFYYLRARYYEAGNGRFVGMGPFRGYLIEPASLHKYSYAASNPSNWIDPSGLFTLTEMSIASDIRSLLGNVQAESGFSLIDASINRNNDSPSAVGWSAVISLIPGAVGQASHIFRGVRFVVNEKVGRGWIKALKGTKPKEIRSVRFLANHFSATVYARGQRAGADLYIAGRKWELKVLTTASPSNAAEKIIDAVKHQGAARVVIDVRDSALGREGVQRAYAEVIRKSARDGFNPPSEFVAILPDQSVLRIP